MIAANTANRDRYSTADYFLDKIYVSLARIIRACGLNIDSFLANVRAAYDRDTVEMKPAVQAGDVHLFLPQAMSLWHQLPQYCDKKGVPLPIPLQGTDRSFQDLLDRSAEYVGKPLSDVNFELLERLLLASECVRKDTDGTLSALRQDFRFSTDGALHPIVVYRSLAGFLSTVSYNATKGQGGHFQSYAWSSCFPRKNIPLLLKEVEDLGNVMLQGVDAFLMNHEDSHASDQMFAGAGVYVQCSDDG